VLPSYNECNQYILTSVTAVTFFKKQYSPRFMPTELLSSTKKNDAADGYTCVGHARVTVAYSMVLAEGSKRHEWHVSIDMCYYIEPFLFIFQFHLV
jgi:hypothetical protein